MRVNAISVNKHFKKSVQENSKLKELTPEEISELHDVLVEILNDFDDICLKNNLTYYVTGGTLLGAIRNNGFIPWDDDIDVSMPRRDFELLKDCLKDFSDKYFLQSLDSDNRYDLNFLKLRKKGTKYVEIFENNPEKAGIAIDIFPLDDTYSNRLLRFVNGIIDEGLFYVASCVRIHQKKGRLLYYAPDSKIQRKIWNRSTLGRMFSNASNPRWIYDKCEMWTKKYINSGSKYVSTSCGSKHYFGEIYEREELFPTKRIKFENIDVNVPKNPTHVLTKLYGSDYIDPQKEKEMHCVIELKI